MRLYWEVAKTGFREQSTYRAAAVAGVVTNSIFGFLRVAVLLAALGASAGRIAGFDERTAITYVWLGQAMIAVIAIWGWADIANRIPTGEIARDLLRPTDFQCWWLARDFGRAAFQTMARGIPQYVIGATFFTVVRPPLTRVVPVAVAIVFAVTISFGMRFIANLLVFWTLQWRGIQIAFNAMIMVFSGLELPLDFYPSWAERILRVLPWYGTVQGPIELFLGRRSAFEVLPLQLFWAATMLLIGRGVFAAATQRVVVQGG